MTQYTPEQLDAMDHYQRFQLNTYGNILPEQSGWFYNDSAIHDYFEQQMAMLPQELVSQQPE